MIIGGQYVRKLLIEQRASGALVLQMDFDNVPNWDAASVTLKVNGNDANLFRTGGSADNLRWVYTLADSGLNSWAVDTLVQGDQRLVYQRRVGENPEAFVKRILGERIDSVPSELSQSIGECASYCRQAKLTNREWLDSWLATFESSWGWYATKSKLQIVQESNFNLADWNAVTDKDIREKLQLDMQSSYPGRLLTPSPLLPPSFYVLGRQIQSPDLFLDSLLSAESSFFPHATIQWPRGPMGIQHSEGKLFLECVRYHFQFEPNSEKIASAMAGIQLSVNSIPSAANSGRIHRVKATFESWKTDELALFSINDDKVLVYKSSSSNAFEPDESRQIIGRIYTHGRDGSESGAGIYFNPVKGDICELQFEQGDVPRFTGILQRRSSMSKDIASTWKSEGKAVVENDETTINENLKVSSSGSTFSQKSTIKDVEIG